MITGATEIFEQFILRSDLTFAENIVLNYAIITKDKWRTMSFAHNFLWRSVIQIAFKNLTQKYNIIKVYEDGSLDVKSNYTRNVVDYKIRSANWRPPKNPIDATHW